MQKRNTNNGNIVAATLTASAFMAFLSSISFFLMSATVTPTASIALTPRAAVVDVDNALTVTVEVTADQPVNAYTGVITFDPNIVHVSKIDYNTSIADLWAKAPWYQNGDGTIHFAGGTTKAGGFVGSGTLMTITFTSIAPGEATIRITEPAILAHDGYGTEATLRESFDTKLTIIENRRPLNSPQPAAQVIVRDPKQTGDLNNDGTVTITDVSIFFMYLTTGDKAGDLNADGRISTTDLSILVSQM